MWLINATRFVQFACALSLFGTAIWRLSGLATIPSARQPGQAGQRALMLFAAMGLLGAIAAVVWLLGEAVMITGRWSAVATLLSAARFAQAAALRAALLVISAIVALLAPHPRRAGWALLAALSAAAIVTFVWTGHGSSGTGATAVVHAVADVLHLFGAALWFGGLVMLSATALRVARIRTSTEASALLDALLQFSAIGPAVIGLLILTGFINTWLLVGPGHWMALFTEPYGQLLTAKVGAFAAMLAVGAHHRYRSTPGLRQVLGDTPRRLGLVERVRTTLLTETALGLLVLAIVAVLGTLEPPATP